MRRWGLHLLLKKLLLSTVNAGYVLGASHEVPAVQGIYKTWHCLWYNLLGLDPEQMHMRPSHVFL